VGTEVENGANEIEEIANIGQALRKNHSRRKVMNEAKQITDVVPMFTVAQAALTTGRSVSTVDKICRKHQIGSKPNAKLRLLSAADLERVRGIMAQTPCQGRPEKIS